MSNEDAIMRHLIKRRKFYGIKEPESLLDGTYYFGTGDKERDAFITMALFTQPRTCPNGCKDPLFKDIDIPEVRDTYYMEPTVVADRIEFVCYECGDSLPAPFFKYRKHDMEIRIAEGEFRK
jgi:hypothetical protein